MVGPIPRGDVQLAQHFGVEYFGDRFQRERTSPATGLGEPFVAQTLSPILAPIRVRFPLEVEFRHLLLLVPVNFLPFGVIVSYWPNAFEQAGRFSPNRR